MWKSRLCYLFVLLGTTTFLICFDGYLSLYVFVLSLLLPVVSLACSLPGDALHQGEAFHRQGEPTPPPPGSMPAKGNPSPSNWKCGTPPRFPAGVSG